MYASAMQGGHNKACIGYDGCINQAEERFHVKGNHINKMHWTMHTSTKACLTSAAI